MLFANRINHIIKMCTFIVALPVGAHSDNFHISSITSKTGLPNNLIYDIDKDQEGYLWVASTSGLARFDGINWQSYTYDKTNPNSLSSNHITKLFIDSEDTIWAGTRNCGINRFDKQSHRFQNYLLEETVTSIAEDNDQTIWVGTLNNGVFHINKNGHIKKRYFKKSSIYNIDIIHDKIFISSDQHGLQILENGKFSLVTKNTVYDIYHLENSLERFWLATDQGLYQLNPKNNISIALLEKYKIMEIQRRANTQLWLATQNSGLILYDIEQNTVLQHLKNNQTKRTLNENNLRSIYVDENNITWVGSTGGINKVVTRPFRTFKNTTSSSGTLSNNYIRDFAEDENGNIWIGFWDGGIEKFNPKIGASTKYPANHTDSIHISKFIYDAKQQVLWIASNKGLYTFDTKRFVRKKIFPISSHLNILAISFTNTKKLLLSTENDGLYIINPLLQKVETQYKHNPDGSKTLAHNTINHAIQIDGTRLLISTAGGLNILNADTNHVVSYKYQRNNNDGLSHKDIIFAMSDSKKELWVNAGGRLNKASYNENDIASFSDFSETLSIEPNIASAIIEDPLGYLWFASQKKIYRFNTNNNSLLSFNQSDNLPYDSNTGRALYLTKNNKIYAGVKDGFIIIDPYEVTPSKVNPPVNITRIMVDNKTQTDPTSIKIKDKNSKLVFHFLALDYLDPSSIQYAYRLEGYQDSWTYSGNQTHAEFINIPEGKYTFSVKAANTDGVWGSNIATAPVIVHHVASTPSSIMRYIPYIILH